ncbi:hypothetical protein EJB05_45319, partial [Eragrostis curvula]
MAMAKLGTLEHFVRQAYLLRQQMLQEMRRTLAEHAAVSARAARSSSATTSRGSGHSAPCGTDGRQMLYTYTTCGIVDHDSIVLRFY